MKEIKIGDKKYSVKVVSSEEDKAKGLMNIKNLPEKEGMLFVFDEPGEVSIWMKDTLIPLDIIFIDKDLQVINVHKGIPESEEYMTELEVVFVLEVNKSSGILEGDELDLAPNKSINKKLFLKKKEEPKEEGKMLVLDPEGGTQMVLDGGERIVSRRETKILIKKAKKVHLLKHTDSFDKACKQLGTYFFKVLEGQDSRDEEYVKK